MHWHISRTVNSGTACQQLSCADTPLRLAPLREGRRLCRNAQALQAKNARPTPLICHHCSAGAASILPAAVVLLAATPLDQGCLGLLIHTIGRQGGGSIAEPPERLLQHLKPCFYLLSAGGRTFLTSDSQCGLSQHCKLPKFKPCFRDLLGLYSGPGL